MKKALLLVLCTVFLLGLADMGHAFLFSFGGGSGGGRGGSSAPAVDASVFQFNFESLRTPGLMIKTSTITWEGQTIRTGNTHSAGVVC